MNDMTEKEPGFIKIKMEMEFALLFIGESVYRVAGSYVLVAPAVALQGLIPTSDYRYLCEL